ncbi:MAG: hypothetical protein IPJ75_04875 [Ignavibacteriales bacterium]|nr:hypothetical protein [Ignavibacteriales bacterium]
MKRTILILSLLVFTLSNVNAQMTNFPDFNNYPGAGTGNISGGAGLVWINDKPHLCDQINP